MSLSDELNRIRDDSLAALDASHNYYAHTKTAWRLVQQMVRDGHTVTIRNQTTGTTTDETQLAGLAQDYVTGYYHRDSWKLIKQVITEVANAGISKL